MAESQNRREGSRPTRCLLRRVEPAPAHPLATPVSQSSATCTASPVVGVKRINCTMAISRNRATPSSARDLSAALHAMAGYEGSGLCATLEVQLREDRADVVLDRLVGQEDFRRDFLVCLPFGHRSKIFCSCWVSCAISSV